MRLPALLLGCAQRGWEIAGAPAEHQFIQPCIGEVQLALGRTLGQLIGLERTHPQQGTAVIGAEKATIKVFIDIAGH